MTKAKRVFFSYAHDSEEHKYRVLQYCNLLRESGLDAWLDQYETFPPQGWPAWMRQQVKRADFVLIVCSKLYYRRVEGEEQEGQGQGAKWEGAIIEQELYELERNNRKFIPVLVDTEDAEFRPTILRPFHYYNLSTDEGREGLYRLLTNQPSVVPPPIAGEKSFAPKSVPPLKPLSHSRVKANISFSASSEGWVPQLRVSNISDTPLFLQNPQLILSREVTPSNHATEPLPAELRHDAVAHDLLPTNPDNAPLLPTQERNYFLPPETLKIIKNDVGFFGKSTPSIRIFTAVSDELILDDSQSIDYLKSLLGFPASKVDASSQPRFHIIGRLVMKRFEDGQKPFKVYPPQLLIEDAGILEQADVVQHLRGKQFLVEFHDGLSEILSFQELLLFTEQLIFFAIRVHELSQQLERAEVKNTVRLNMNVNVFPDRVLQSDIARHLLSKLTFEKEPFVARK